MREVDKTILLMISKVIGSANIFVLSIFFARMLLKEDYGTYIQVNMLIGLLVLLLSLGIPPSLFYFLPKENNHRHLIKRTFVIMLSVGCLNLIALYTLKAHISRFLNNDALAQYIVLAGVCIICRMSYNLIQPILLVLRRSVVLAGINTFKGILLFFTMTGCLFADTGLTVLIYIFTLNYIIEFTISLWVIARYSANFGDSYDHVIVPLRSQFRFALPLAMSGVLWIIGREIDKYIVSHYLSPENLAVYARGAVEIPLVQIFAATIAQVYLPNWVSLFDKKEFGTLIANWHLTISKTALIMFPVFALFLVIGHDFIILMYSTEYVGSVSIFMIYLFLVPLQLTEYTAIVESSGKTILISFGYIFQILLNIIFSSLLIKSMGSQGPALVTVLSMYLWVGYVLFIISRIFRVPFIKILPWKRLMRVMAIGLFAGLICLLLKSWLDSMGVFSLISNQEVTLLIGIVVTGLVYVMLYLCLLYLTKTLDHDDLATISRWLLLNKLKKGSAV